MNLFTDGDFITTANLVALDPEITKVAAAMNIVIAGTGGLIPLAISEVGKKLLAESQSSQGYLTPWAAPYNQSAAVLNATLPSVQRARISLSQIVVSSPYPGWTSALADYTLYWSLYMFYRSAYQRKVEDRYEKKMKEYLDEARKTYWPRFYVQGVPAVYKPLACPGAAYEPGAGIWGAANVTSVAGINPNSTTTSFVVATWTDAAQGYVSQTNKGSGESGSSPAVSVSVPTANVIHVDISSLTAPDGSGPVSLQTGQGLYIRGQATGWNVWVGTAPNGPYFLQTASPLPIATKSYTLSGPPSLSGFACGTGQLAQAMYTMQRTLFRG